MTDQLSEVTHVYVGKRPCGCVVSVCCDDAFIDKKCATSVRDWVGDCIMAGQTIERMELEAYRKIGLYRCSEHIKTEFIEAGKVKK